MKDVDYASGKAELSLACVAEADGYAAGYTFRAAELRYDARGGMTKEQARRRFEPGAVWSVRGVKVVVKGESYFHGAPWAHFHGRQPEEFGGMNRERGWRLVALAPAAPPRRPVCPRCLDIEPGMPGGTPEAPHPGPFTPRLCGPCESESDR